MGSKKKVSYIGYVKYLLVFLLAITISSCTDDPGTDSPYGAITDKPGEITENPFTDTAESDIKDLDMILSVVYSKPTTTEATDLGQVACYIKIMDQDNAGYPKLTGDTFNINEDNFEVFVNGEIIMAADRDFSKLTSGDSVSYVITFPNTLPENSYVSVLFSLRYLNYWGWHTADFATTYFVQP